MFFIWFPKIKLCWFYVPSLEYLLEIFFYQPLMFDSQLMADLLCRCILRGGGNLRRRRHRSRIKRLFSIEMPIHRLISPLPNTATQRSKEALTSLFQLPN